MYNKSITKRFLLEFVIVNINMQSIVSTGSAADAISSAIDDEISQLCKKINDCHSIKELTDLSHACNKLASDNKPSDKIKKAFKTVYRERMVELANDTNNDTPSCKRKCDENATGGDCKRVRISALSIDDTAKLKSRPDKSTHVHHLRYALSELKKLVKKHHCVNINMKSKYINDFYFGDKNLRERICSDFRKPEGLKFKATFKNEKEELLHPKDIKQIIKRIFEVNALMRQ